MENKSVSAIKPDWEREKIKRWWSPSKQLLKSIRKYQNIQKSSFFLLKYFRFIYVLQHRFWSIVTGAEIPLNCQLGGGLLLPHPNGIVIHPEATIGSNCLLFQQVTIVKGVKVGGHVDILQG